MHNSIIVVNLFAHKVGNSLFRKTLFLNCFRCLNGIFNHSNESHKFRAGVEAFFYLHFCERHRNIVSGLAVPELLCYRRRSKQELICTLTGLKVPRRVRFRLRNCTSEFLKYRAIFPRLSLDVGIRRAVGSVYGYNLTDFVHERFYIVIDRCSCKYCRTDIDNIC